MYDKTMNILYLTPIMGIGGEESSTLTLAREMIKRGHRAFIKGNNGPMSEEFRKVGANVITSSKPYRRSIAGILSDARDIKTIVQKNGIDIIHSQSVLPTISAFLALRDISEKPELIFHERGIGKLSYYIVPKLFNYLVDFVITNSDHELGILKKNGLRVPCIRIHNCCNVYNQNINANIFRDELQIKKDACVLGIVGRLTHEKGHVFLLESLRHVINNQKSREFVLLIVGDGPLMDKVKKRVITLSLDNNVIFTGFRRDLEKIYPAMNMLIVPSLFETFGNVAVEASSWGVPVIASAVGGLPEALLNGESGLLVPPGNVEKLTTAIKYLLDNPDIAQKLGTRGKAFASTYFNLERVADEVEAVYKKLYNNDFRGAI